MGPTWSYVQQSGVTPAALTNPYVGFNPTIPQNAAGNRIDPAVSVPSAAKHIPVATAAADPDEDPPVVLDSSQGFLTGPNWLMTPLPPYANSCKFNLPRKTAPASRSRCTTVASRSGIRFR